MKFNSLFLPIISLATVSSLFDIHPASAQSPSVVRCPGGSRCGVYTPQGPVRGGGTLPAELLQQLNDLKAQGNFAEAERLLLQFKEQAERTQDLNGQAAANQALGDVYTRMNKLDSASSHLINADALYQRLGNPQRSSEVKQQLGQIQLQQIRLQQR